MTTVRDPAPEAARPEASEQQQRIHQLRARMADRGLTAVAVASPEGVYYLTGLDHLGYFAFTLLIVPAHGELTIVTREMERPTIRAQVPHCRHVTFGDGTDPAAVAACALSESVLPGDIVGVEDGAMFFPPSIRGRLERALPGVTWHDASPLITRAMAVKSPTEIDLVRRAATVSDTAMTAAIAAAGVGVSEHQVAAAVHHAMFSHGGGQPGFSPLIRPLSMLDQEHVSWGDRTLGAATGLFVELSGCFRRYHAPQSRTIYIGRPAPGAAEAHAAALDGLAAARTALRPGVLTGDVYDTWQRTVTGSDDRGTPQRHHCGYLVGIGFPPSWVGGSEVLGICRGGQTPIAPGMTFHLMSWVAGHVVSDTALVTSHGTELLTTTSRELLVVT